MKIRAAPWTAAVGRIMRSLAVFGSLGPDGASLAAQYVAVLGEMAAVSGHDFAIEYDDKLRSFIAKEAYTIAQARPYLQAADDARVNAQQQKDVRRREQAKASTGKSGGGHPPGPAAQGQRDPRNNNPRNNNPRNRGGGRGYGGGGGRGDRRDERRDDHRHNLPDVKLLGPPPSQPPKRGPPQGGHPANKRQRGNVRP